MRLARLRFGWWVVAFLCAAIAPSLSSAADSEIIPPGESMAPADESALAQAEATPAGACCLPDGRCLFVPRDVCVEEHGEFVDEFVPCEPNPCSPSLGACCAEDLCYRVTPSYCKTLGGDFLGSEIECDPIPCATPVDILSWGAVKIRFRS